jgi:hypothetical protein
MSAGAAVEAEVTDMSVACLKVEIHLRRARAQRKPIISRMLLIDSVH